MKRYYFVMLFVLVLLISWQVTTTIVAQMNINATLLAYGQTPIPLWLPVIRGHPMIGTLTTGQLDLYNHERIKLMSDIKFVDSQPDGYFVPVIDPDAVDGSSRVPKADWLTLDAYPALAKLDAHISSLTSQ